MSAGVPHEGWRRSKHERHLDPDKPLDLSWSGEVRWYWRRLLCWFFGHPEIEWIDDVDVRVCTRCDRTVG